MLEHDILSQSKQNMRLTRVFVLLAFASNAAVNFLLIGYFARVGGIELVGHWAFLGAVMLAVMILDFGSVNALTYRIAKDGLDNVACVLRQLLRLAALTAAVLALGLAGAVQFADEIVQGSLLAGLAALLQLASSWLVAIRMGRQQQYWFNIKTIIRVMVQASAAVMLLQRGLPFPDILVFGMALVLGGFAELLMAVLLTFREFSLRGAGASFASVRKLIVGFSITDIGQRAYQPLSQLLVAQLLGAAAVGIFTVALRIPVVVNQALNEALRALLPSLAKMLSHGDLNNAIRLLRDSVATQLILVVPAGIFLLAHAPHIIGVWLGQSDPAIVSAIRLFTAALIVSALGTPFHWAAQAGGQASLLGKVGLGVMVFVLVAGAIMMTVTGDILNFALVYAIGQATRDLSTITICAVKLRLVQPVVAQLRWYGAVGYLSVVVMLNTALIFASEDMAALEGFLMVTGLNVIVIGPLAFLCMSRKWI